MFALVEWADYYATEKTSESIEGKMWLFGQKIVIFSESRKETGAES